MVSSLRINGRQDDLLRQMLAAGPDVVRSFRGSRNWLLVRDGSADHQQLLALESLGCVYRGRCRIRGFCCFHGTQLGCECVGLTWGETEKALRHAERNRSLV